MRYLFLLLLTVVSASAENELPAEHPATITVNGSVFTYSAEWSTAVYWYYECTADYFIEVSGNSSGPGHFQVWFVETETDGVYLEQPIDSTTLVFTGVPQWWWWTAEDSGEDANHVLWTTAPFNSTWFVLEGLTPEVPPDPPTENYQIFLAGFTLGATIRLFKAGLRWVKRIGDDREIA